jgi:hypothetical protein
MNIIEQAQLWEMSIVPDKLDLSGLKHRPEALKQIDMWSLYFDFLITNNNTTNGDTKMDELKELTFKFLNSVELSQEAIDDINNDIELSSIQKTWHLEDLRDVKAIDMLNDGINNIDMFDDYLTKNNIWDDGLGVVANQCIKIIQDGYQESLEKHKSHYWKLAVEMATNGG